jgi:transposase InsO family protein
MSNYGYSNRLVLLPPVEPAQYASEQITRFAAENGITRSMGRTGVCLLTG